MSISTPHFIDLQQEYYEMPEMKLRRKLSSFNNSIYILDKNFSELQNFIARLEDTESGVPFISQRHRDKIEQAQQHLLRLLHNAVASATTLIDHTRNLYKVLYRSTNQFPEYQARIDSDFKDDPLAQFVKGLRQYCVHYKTPDIVFKWQVINVDNKQIERNIVALQLNDLKLFGKWSQKAKEFLENASSDVEIGSTMSAYYRKVMGFYAWFQSRQQEIHADEILVLEQKNTELALSSLELKINLFLNNIDNPAMRAEDIFLGILLSDDYVELENMTSANNRAKRAIEILRTYLPLSDELATKIKLLYDNPNFLNRTQSLQQRTQLTDEGESKSLFGFGFTAKKQINIVAELSEEEYWRLSQTTSHLRHLRKIVQTFDSIATNHADFEVTLTYYTNKATENSNTFLKTNTPKIANLDFKRLIQNHLSGIWLAFDQLTMAIAQQYGMRSKQFTDFEALMNSVHATDFSIRLLMQLKNYVPHFGVPLLTTFSLFEESSQSHIHAILDIEELKAKAPLIDSRFIEEFARFDDEDHEWGALLSNCKISLQNLFQKIVDLLVPHLIEPTTLLQEMIQSLPDIDLTPAVFTGIERLETTTNIQYTPVPMSMLKLVTDWQHQNRSC